MSRRTIRALIIAAVALLLLVLGGRLAVRFYTDILWYREVEYLGTFWTRFWLGLGVRVAAAVLGAGLLFLNLWFVARHLGSIRVRRRYGNLEIAERIPRRYVLGLSAVVAVLGGWWLAELQFGPAAVMRAATWMWRVPWGVQDPLFGRDVAFFVFGLPFALDVLGFLVMAGLWSLLLVGLGHVLSGGIRWDENRVVMARPARLHLAVLVGALLVLLGVRYWLGMYLLAIDGTGVAGSLGYSDAQARIPAYRAMAGLAAFAAGALVYGAWRGHLLLPALGLSALLAGALLLATAYPALVQRFQVEPNELSREAPYIRWHLDFTRRAYGLTELRRQSFPYRMGALPGAERLEPLYARLPLWDSEPLRQVFNEVQVLFDYYRFPDADVDRYGPPGDELQVVIGVREFHPEGLDQASRTWQSLHLNPTYIRGRGAVISPALPLADGRGTAEFLVRNLDPVEVHPLAPDPVRLVQPSVFFGETMDGYVVVVPGRDGQFTGEAGVDYPRGIPLSSLLRIFAFAWRFGDETLLFAREMTADSRLVFRRPLRERLAEIAPFIVWDNDPLPVVFQGRIVWLVDGYTASTSFPLARAVAMGRTRIRYLRNSVKAAVDAVTGTVTFYTLDGDDPMLATYARLFPELFQPLDRMPADLRRHLRYPELALLAQSEILQEYHLDRVEAFYAGQNVWQRPQQSAPGGGVRSYRPMRGLMPVPMADTVEFIAAVPYIARGRQNMTAMLMVRNDEPRYGELTLLEFPRDQQVPGPAQIQAMIEQDPIIAPELSLLRQRGSTIDMGTLRVLPLDSSVLYVQPFFLSADLAAIPELWGIAASDGSNISLASTLQAAVAGLDLLRPGEPAAPAREPWAHDTRIPLPGIPPRRALDLLEQAEARLRAGDWAGYGRALQDLRRVLEEMNAQDPHPGGSP
jgi:uncharacterized protein